MTNGPKSCIILFVANGWVPEWLKGADCKSAAFRFVGSNPSPPIPKDKVLLVGNDLIFYE